MNLESSFIYEDEDLLIIDKPQGLATGLGGQESLCAVLFARLPELSNVQGYKEGEGGLLNRLDNETGGLVLFAKHNKAFEYFKQEMKASRVRKKYCAICNGSAPDSQGTITIPLAHHHAKKNRMVRADTQQHRSKSQPAETFWRLKDSIAKYSVVSIDIFQGVRHQIRVHLSCIGLPVLGDSLYNKIKDDPNSGEYHALYCTGLECSLQSGKTISINIDCPLYSMWDAIKNKADARV